MKMDLKPPWKFRGKKARDAREVTNYMGADVTVYESIDPNVTSEFVGYEHLTWESDVTVLTTETEIADALSEGEHGTVFVQETPFYATSGGQEADTGYIRTAEGEFKVEDTVKIARRKSRSCRSYDKGNDQIRR